ncbi:MAG: histidine phosphatase family protein [Ferruginibacter sp.]
MKNLFIVRHAKSSWDDINLNDFERPLNERGKKDAPAMAEKMQDQKIKIDAFVSSPAKRARKTCEAFCKVYNVPKEKIIFEDDLYNAVAKNFYDVIEKIDDENKRVAIFSHNPGITDFVNSLISSVNIDNMPTCAVFAIKSDIETWLDFRTSEKHFLFFEYPKHN